VLLLLLLLLVVVALLLVLTLLLVLGAEFLLPRRVVVESFRQPLTGSAYGLPASSSPLPPSSLSSASARPSSSLSSLKCPVLNEKERRMEKGRSE